MTQNPTFPPGYFSDTLSATAETPPPTAAGTSLDTLETTGKSAHHNTYREFLTSGCKPDMSFAEDLYWRWDARANKNRHSQFIQCRTMARFLVHKTTREVRVGSTSCGLRWCPLCYRTKRFVITESVKGWLPTREKPKFLTFTLKHNTSPLTEQIDALYKFFRAIRKHKFFKSKIKGGIWFFQIKKSKDGQHWHPHIHCLVEGKFIAQKELSALWKKITHGSKIVDIRAVKNVNKAAEYVARYAAAPTRLLNYDIGEAVEVAEALHGRRICGTWGTAKGVALRPQSPDDVADWVDVDSWCNIKNGLHCDDFAAALWNCWVQRKPYNGDLPEPPPKIDIAFQKEMDRPRTFVQNFFEFYNPNIYREKE